MLYPGITCYEFSEASDRPKPQAPARCRHRECPSTSRRRSFRCSKGRSIVSDVTDAAPMVPWCWNMHTYNVRPPVDSVQLVQITPISIWFMVFIAIVTGANKPTYILGDSHCT